DSARSLVFTRQKQREGAAFAGDAGDANLAAQQARNLATDGKTKAGAAVFATGRTVRLLERFNDDSLFLSRNANPRIADRKCDDILCAIQRLEHVLLIFTSRTNLQTDVSLFGEFERVRQQVHQNLLQTFVVSDDQRIEVLGRL